MRSSRATTAAALLSRGLRFESGSPEESLAKVALEKERRVQFLQTLAIVNAIISTGNLLVSAITKSPSNQQGGDGVGKCIEALRELLLPEEAEKTQRDADRARSVLEKEMKKGPIKFRPMSHTKKRKRRNS